uniref:Reverse transcriptase domain-containing protein n=1 Tax=Tanacetum cinerariifolium TaxID=118510 RepID=A0A6L2MC12_TANCI|nr:reverse transcriptase domain-containing protein [Tanacetum cinerariifolium]
MKDLLRNYHEHNLTKGNILKIFYHGLNETTQEALNAAAGGIFLYKTPNQAYQLLEDKVLLKLDWAKNQKPKAIIRKTTAFADEGSSNFDTDKIMTPDCNDDDTSMSREEEAQFMQTFRPGMPNYGKFLKELVNNKHKLEQISFAFLSDESSAMIQNKVPPKLEDLGSFLVPYTFDKAFSCNALADLGASINLMPYSLIDVIDEILEEDSNALLDEGSLILYSIDGTPLEEKLFAEFDEFMAMTRY